MFIYTYINTPVNKLITDLKLFTTFTSFRFRDDDTLFIDNIIQTMKNRLILFQIIEGKTLLSAMRISIGFSFRWKQPNNSRYLRMRYKTNDVHRIREVQLVTW